MGADLTRVSMLARREIEARMAVPLVRAFIQEVGREKALDILGRVIESLAEESGRMLAVLLGGKGLEDFARGLPLWSRDNAVDFELLESSADKVSMNVTRCGYAEMYKELGMEEFGYTLSCGRDFAMVRGFNPGIKLTRTQTVMEGADFCDFRFEMTG